MKSFSISQLDPALEAQMRDRHRVPSFHAALDAMRASAQAFEVVSGFTDPVNADARDVAALAAHCAFVAARDAVQLQFNELEATRK